MTENRSAQLIAAPAGAVCRAVGHRRCRIDPRHGLPRAGSRLAVSYPGKQRDPEAVRRQDLRSAHCSRIARRSLRWRRASIRCCRRKLEPAAPVAPRAGSGCSRDRSAAGDPACHRIRGGSVAATADHGVAGERIRAAAGDHLASARDSGAEAALPRVSRTGCRAAAARAPRRKPRLAAIKHATATTPAPTTAFGPYRPPAKGPDRRDHCGAEAQPRLPSSNATTARRQDPRGDRSKSRPPVRPALGRGLSARPGRRWSTPSFQCAPRARSSGMSTATSTST